MKPLKKPVFFIVFILILGFAYLAFFGIHGHNGDIPLVHIKGIKDIRWGIDIKGGVEVTYSPAENVDASKEQIDSAKSIIEIRMVQKGITDYEIYSDYANKRIIVRFPWKEDEKDFNPEESIEELSATAVLTFREGNEFTRVDYNDLGEQVRKTPKGVTAENILLEGKDVEKAAVGVDNNGKYFVQLKFNEEGKVKFADATQKMLNKTMSIWMDDEMISDPVVNSVITEGVASITGNFSAEEATALANKISAGALPFKLETTNFGSISPTLGTSAINAMGLAGVIAFGLVCLFMILKYRLPGFIASIALLGQMGLSVAAVSRFFAIIPSFTMTLPGIAGLILSIGMGVDANVITAERIKEELKNGKTIVTSVICGNKASLSAILDGNVTVMIVAFILMAVFGPSNILSALFGASTTGIIYSFGYTLLVGAISNFIMGIGASRLMLKSIISFNCFRKKWLFGGASV